MPSMIDDTHDAIALFDMDGTLCDYGGAMRRGLEALRSPHEPPEAASLDNDAAWAVARRQLVRSQSGFWRDLAPMPRGFDVLAIACELAFEIHILTKGPSNTASAWTEKLQWCSQHIPDHPVTITMKKSLVYGKVLVDDYPPYFMSWLEVRPRGLVIAPAHPWNEGAAHPNLVRYDGTNLDEVRTRMTQVRAAVAREP